MKIKFSIVLLLAALHVYAQPMESPIYQDIAYLSADTLKGRTTGSRGEKLAAAYIAQRFQSLGMKPAGQLGTYFQFFTGKILANPHATHNHAGQVLEGKNVIGFLDNAQEKTIVIGAHYDHLGMGQDGSLYVGEPEVHNGADDNASGTAALMDLAVRLSDNDDFNYLFIAFSGEERGLWGSNFWTKNPTYPLEKIACMINMDMIGRLDKSRGLAIHGTGTAAEWEELMSDLKNKFSDTPIKEFESGIGPSDFSSFYSQEIPVLSFFTGQHEDYHKPTDDIEKINFEGIETVLSMVDFAVEFAEGKGELHYKETQDDSPEVPAFTVTLGVMPDYLYSDGGMRIDGVKPGRPADNAGIEKGDVVIHMGDLEVTDVMTYMKALSKYKAGDQAPIRVKRGKKEIDLTVQF